MEMQIAVVGLALPPYKEESAIWETSRAFEEGHAAVATRSSAKTGFVKGGAVQKC
jgi:hypothetical protein